MNTQTSKEARKLSDEFRIAGYNHAATSASRHDEGQHRDQANRLFAQSRRYLNLAISLEREGK